jgi:hypothetical protein
MTHPHLPAAATPHDLTRIIKLVERELTAGLNIDDSAAVLMLHRSSEILSRASSQTGATASPNL